MGSEEKLTWDALELPERNCKRLIEKNKRAKKAAVEKAREGEKARVYGKRRNNARLPLLTHPA